MQKNGVKIINTSESSAFNFCKIVIHTETAFKKYSLFGSAYSSCSHNLE